MQTVKTYAKNNLPTQAEKEKVVNFLFTHLEEYGDKPEDIKKALDYALGEANAPGGAIFALTEDDQILSAAIINKTGMKGYIPENILVYIATHNQQRGKGIGKEMMQQIIEKTEGDIALHVEPENPAVFLYKKLGFTNKYLEMRLIKN